MTHNISAIGGVGDHLKGQLQAGGYIKLALSQMQWCSQKDGTDSLSLKKFADNDFVLFKYNLEIQRKYFLTFEEV